MSEKSELNTEVVAEFLKTNPEFFVGRDELLLNIRVPHSSGKAISLVEKQLNVMRERNTELRNRLSDLIENARSNDRLFSHSRKLVLALMDCKTLAQAVDVIHASFANEFGVEYTQIILFESSSISRARQVDLGVAQDTIGKYLKARQTIGGGIGEKERAFLFGADANHIGSAALAVLAYGDLYGVIAIGNRDPNYYHSGMGTLFLSYIAEVFSRILRDFIERR